MYSKKLKITKEKIRYYLKLYQHLDSMIKQRELSHVKYAPSLIEFKYNINTIEKQVISMVNDFKLQEMRFYKKSLDRLLYTLKITEDYKYYDFLLWKYIKRLPKKEIQKKLGNVNIEKIDEIIIDYLFFNIETEAKKYEN